MSAYAPASSLGWLDLDLAASERVGTLLRALEEPGTLDVLGLGSVRDVFSSMLSPGTSTIQTRLRYFIFLPWIFEQLEHERVAPADFARRLRELEGRLIDCLKHLGANQGVIGINAGRNVKRLPSEAYWGGLGSWGLRRLDLSLAEYGKTCGRLGKLHLERDDDGNAVERSLAMWANIPEAPDTFLKEDIDFALGPGEADVLIDCIRQRHPDSLLAWMCGKPALAGSVDAPWEIADDAMPAPLVETLHHARCFSELTVGPQHLYNVLLARKASRDLGWDTAAVERRELVRLDEWVTLLDERHATLSAWVGELDSFWAFVGREDSISGGTRTFIESMVTRAVQHSSTFMDDPGVHAAIAAREQALKGKRARLTNRSALENWNQEPFGGQLTYRWGITQGYLSDLADALGPG